MFLKGILQWFTSHRVEPGVAGPTCTKLDTARLALDDDEELSSRHVEMDGVASTMNLHLVDEVVETHTTSPTNPESDYFPGLGLDVEASDESTE